MRLDTVARGDAALLYMERYVDEGARSYSPFAAKTEAAPAYQPRGRTPSFELVTVRVPEERVTVFEADPASDVRRFYLGEGVTFPVHPEIWASGEAERGDELRALPKNRAILVAPTASTRTVLVLESRSDVAPHFLKLHYPRRISRFNRRLRRKNVENSVAVTRDLAQLRSDRFAYLSDALGCVFGDGDSAWGFLVRERAPRPFVPDRTLIPCFALYGGELEHPDHVPLIVQMIDRLDADPVSFVVDEIMVPVVECWAKVARERGILLESHAQNTLLEVDRDLRPRRIVHRDFDVWIDAGLRRRAGLGMDAFRTTIEDEPGHPIEQHYSLLYDRFIGREFFDYLLRAIVRFHSVDADAVRGRVREAFHRAFPDADRLFPARTTFYFSNEPQPGNGYQLVDMHELPAWR